MDKKFRLFSCVIGLIAAAALALSGCMAQPSLESSGTTVAASAAADFWSMDAVHTISVEFSDADYQAMLDTFSATGDKEWIKAAVTIDGTTFDEVGLRLKGNSSLRGLRGQNKATTAEEPGEGDGQIDSDDP